MTLYILVPDNMSWILKRKLFFYRHKMQIKLIFTSKNTCLQKPIKKSE